LSNFRVMPIPASVTRRIRQATVDDFGHQLFISIATESDSGPCRSCLTVFTSGERRILFSYAPNEYDHPYNEIGPIYIHEKECEPYTDFESFPPQLRTRRPLALRCYDEDGMLVDGELVGERSIEEVIEQLFQRPKLKYLHARTATVGCYIARIERAQD